MQVQVETAGKTISHMSKQSIEHPFHIIKHLPKLLCQGKAALQWINGILQNAGGRCDEPPGSEHLSRCVIPLDKSFHHHLRRAFRGAEQGSMLPRPKASLNKIEDRGVGTKNTKA